MRTTEWGQPNGQNRRKHFRTKTPCGIGRNSCRAGVKSRILKSISSVCRDGRTSGRATLFGFRGLLSQPAFPATAAAEAVDDIQQPRCESFELKQSVGSGRD